MGGIEVSGEGNILLLNGCFRFDETILRENLLINIGLGFWGKINFMYGEIYHV